MEKTCKDCGVTKPMSEFYRHPKMKDGTFNNCKSCYRAQMRDHNDSEEKRRYLSDYRARVFAERREKHADIRRRWAHKHPERHAAHKKVNRALKSGVLVKWPACAIPDCDCRKVEAHHADYSRPLDVVWLCIKHHRQAHIYID